MKTNTGKLSTHHLPAIFFLVNFPFPEIGRFEHTCWVHVQLPMKMGAFSHRVKFLIVAVIISVCVLLYFVKSKADDDDDDALRTNLVSDRMKLNVSGLEGGASKVRVGCTFGSPGHEKAHTRYQVSYLD